MFYRGNDMIEQGTIELSVGIEGMTCASCVNRIERFLRDADGVAVANVNLATERATVKVDPAVAGRAEVEAAIEAAGYDVRPEHRSATSGALTLDDGEVILVSTYGGDGDGRRSEPPPGTRAGSERTPSQTLERDWWLLIPSGHTISARTTPAE